MLATLRLLDLQLVLLRSGREIGRRCAPLNGTTIEAVAMNALTQMRELMLMPGMLVTIDLTTVSAENTSAKIDAAIQHKLFKVLPCHISAGEHVTVESPQAGLLKDACTQ